MAMDSKRVAVIVLCILMTVVISLFYATESFLLPLEILRKATWLGILGLFLHSIGPILSVLGGLLIAWKNPTSISGPLLGTVAGTLTFWVGFVLLFNAFLIASGPNRKNLW